MAGNRIPAAAAAAERPKPVAGSGKKLESETKQKGTNLLNHYDVKISHKREKVVTEITDVMLGGINRYLIRSSCLCPTQPKQVAFITFQA